MQEPELTLVQGPHAENSPRVLEPPTHLIIGCPDPRKRLLLARRRFLLDTYGLEEGQCFPLNLDGGPAVLAYASGGHRLRTHYASLHMRMEDICDKLAPQIEEVLLFTHWDCAHYAHVIPPRKGDPLREKNDLPEIIRATKVILPGKKVGGFYEYADPRKPFGVGYLQM